MKSLLLLAAALLLGSRTRTPRSGWVEVDLFNTNSPKWGRPPIRFLLELGADQEAEEVLADHERRTVSIPITGRQTLRCYVDLGEGGLKGWTEPMQVWPGRRVHVWASGATMATRSGVGQH